MAAAGAAPAGSLVPSASVAVARSAWVGTIAGFVTVSVAAAGVIARLVTATSPIPKLGASVYVSAAGASPRIVESGPTSVFATPLSTAGPACGLLPPPQPAMTVRRSATTNNRGARPRPRFRSVALGTVDAAVMMK